MQKNWNEGKREKWRRVEATVKWNKMWVNFCFWSSKDFDSKLLKSISAKYFKQFKPQSPTQFWNGWTVTIWGDNDSILSQPEAKWKVYKRLVMLAYSFKIEFISGFRLNLERIGTYPKTSNDYQNY